MGMLPLAYNYSILNIFSSYNFTLPKEEPWNMQKHGMEEYIKYLEV